MRVSHEVAGKLTAGATIFEALPGARESSSKIAVGRSPRFHTVWRSSCWCLWPHGIAADIPQSKEAERAGRGPLRLL